jgi:hypothetical protein
VTEIRQHRLTEPRSWFSLFRATGGWIALVAGVLLLGLTLFSVSQYRLAASFDIRGIEAAATITSGRIVKGDESDDHYATFAYVAAGEQAMVVEEKVSRSFYRGMTIGDTQVIRYLPERPEKMEYYIGKTRSDARWIQVVALFAGIGGLVALWYSGNTVNRAIKARRHGVLTPVTVDRIVETKDDDDKPSGKGQIHWSGAGLAGRSLPHPMSDFASITPGDTIQVFMFNGEGWWEGDVGPRARVPSALPVVPLPPGE